MAPFNHLHAHSYYSFLEGLPSPADLAETAARYEMKALALTDRISLSGAIEFYLACQQAGIQPILGLQVPVSSPLDYGPAFGDLVVLASDLSGWRSLCRLSSTLLSDPSAGSEQVLPFAQFAGESRGLLCLTGSGLDQLVQGGQIEAARRYLGQLADIFPNRLYVELQRRTPVEGSLSNQLAIIAGEMNLPILAANEIYYLSSEDADLQKLSTAMRLNQPVGSLPDTATPHPVPTSPARWKWRNDSAICPAR